MISNNGFLLGVVAFILAMFCVLIWLCARIPWSEMLFLLKSLRDRDEPMLKEMRAMVSASDEQQTRRQKEIRDDLREMMRDFNDNTQVLLKQMIQHQRNTLESFSRQLTDLTSLNENKLNHMRSVLDNQLKTLQEDNSRKLELMRQTVDEKLHKTLEKRLGESFHLVSERLEKVHQGLGEMQTLASGVGDLKKVLTNVKTRGVWGEIQLGNILEQIMSKDQYQAQVVTKKSQKSNDPVDFVILLPGRESQNIHLPIDAKFPMEDYERMIQAQEDGDLAGVEVAARALEQRIKLEARSIRDKYIDPPFTTDFAILFVPVEGVYAEILRRPGLVERIQNDHRIVVSGPTTIVALLNSLQMGFRSLAVEKRASEVWSLLGVVKTEFGRFGTLLEKTQDKIQQVGKSMELAARKSRTIESKLKKVEALSDPSETKEKGGLLVVDEVAE